MFNIVKLSWIVKNNWLVQATRYKCLQLHQAAARRSLYYGVRILDGRWTLLWTKLDSLDAARQRAISKFKKIITFFLLNYLYMFAFNNLYIDKNPCKKNKYQWFLLYLNLFTWFFKNYLKPQSTVQGDEVFISQ